MGRNDDIEIFVRITGETPGAFEVWQDLTGIECLLPKSQIKSPDPDEIEVDEDEEIEISIPEWLAEDRGLK